jgi:hypothetical protein
MGSKSLNTKQIILKITFLVSLFVWRGLNAQYNFVERAAFTPKIDTLRFDHRSGGAHIDSLDKAYYDLFPTLFNAGRGYLPQFRAMSSWGTYRHYFSDERPSYRADYHFTALPYTGFFYAFGSGGEQVLDLRYTQNIGKNFNLSFRYHRTVADPIQTAFLMRNIETKSNDVSFKLHYNKRRVNSFLSTYYSFDNYRENFGTDATQNQINTFPLEQLPIRNTIAAARIRRLQINLRNEYDLSRDSSQAFLWVSNLGLHNFQRRYKDSISLGSFDSWIYDSMNTLDLWEEPHLLIENGLQLDLKQWKIYGGFHLDYFTYFNREIRESRLDGILQGAAKLKTDKILWNNHLRFFIFGTPGEYNLNSTLSYSLDEKWQVGYEAVHERIFPEFFQLHFRGNHIAYDYSSTTISPSVRTYLEGSATYGKKRQLKFSVAYLNVNNLYYFENQGWNFTGKQNVLAPALSWKLKRGPFGWNGKAKYFLGEKELFFSPDYFVSTRLFLDGALFKAKRLKVATGIEAQYLSGHQTLAYLPELGVFGQFNGVATLPQQNLIINAFVNLQMDRFRFFLAANRINTLFEPEAGNFVESYPLRPFFIRAGITWDFVN